MKGYEYGNARLRAMRSRLLSRRELMDLAAAKSLPDLIIQISHTPYRKALEVSLVQTSDLESIYEALRCDFIETIAKVRSFYDGSERKLVDLILRAYDIHNLKTILRGLAHNVPRPEIETAMLPTTDLPAALLSELLRTSNPRGAIDLLATIRHAFAQPLLTLRAEHPGADLFDMEYALDCWRFTETTKALRSEDEGGRRVLLAQRLELDILNLLLVFRFIQSPTERQALKARLGEEGLGGLMPGTGNLSIDLLNRIGAVKNIRMAVDLLSETPYADAVRAGFLELERSGLISDMERALRRYQLLWNKSQLVKDPLGIGVVMGYLALKTNEINNLRRAARGIHMKQAPDAIQMGMELVE